MLHLLSSFVVPLAWANGIAARPAPALRQSRWVRGLQTLGWNHRNPGFSGARILALFLK